MSLLRQFSSRLLPSLLLPLLLAATSAAQVSFSSAHPYNVTSGYASIDDALAADLNHDGHTDLLLLSNPFDSATGQSKHAGILYVVLNNGDGTFRAPVAWNFAADVSRMAVGDFNGDKILDVAVTTDSGTISSVTVKYGDGTGGFSSTQTVGSDPSGLGPSITTGDFNNDNKTDIAVESGNRTISIFTNTGSGFTQSKFSAATYFDTAGGGAAGRDWISDVVSGDFNADGKADLAYVDHCRDENICPVPEERFYIETNSGSSFTPTLLTQAFTGTRRLRSADVDLDGRSDLYFAYDGCHTPCVGAEVLFSQGNGTFVQSNDFSDGRDGTDPLDAIIGDFNNDGIMDVATGVSLDWGGSSGFNVNVGLGNRQFSATPAHFADPDSTGSPLFILAGFFSTDGKKDIAFYDTASGNFEIYLNTRASTSGGCLYNSGVGDHFCLPASGATVSSPVRVQASYHPRNYPANRVEIWIDGVKRQQIFNDRVDSSFALASGSHTITISGVDSARSNYKSTHTFTVGGTSTACSPPSSAGVHICSPTSGATVSSPVSFRAAARAASGNIASMRIYVDSVSKFTQSNPVKSTTESISTSISLSAGTHSISIIGYQSTGGTVKASESITVH